MLTVTISGNPAEAAVAKAAYETGAASPEAYLQERVEKLVDEMRDQYKVGEIFPGDYILRFTAAENAAITASADPVVQGFLAEVRSASRVVLYSDEVVQGHAYLVANGLLTQTRSDEILAY
jgi:hypothetical protein